MLERADGIWVSSALLISLLLYKTITIHLVDLALNFCILITKFLLSNFSIAIVATDNFFSFLLQCARKCCWLNSRSCRLYSTCWLTCWLCWFCCLSCNILLWFSFCRRYIW